MEDMIVTVANSVHGAELTKMEKNVQQMCVTEISFTEQTTPKYWSILQIYFVKNDRKTILSTLFAGVYGKVADIKWPVSQSKSKFQITDYSIIL